LCRWFDSAPGHQDHQTKSPTAKLGFLLSGPAAFLPAQQGTEWVKWLINHQTPIMRNIYILLLFVAHLTADATTAGFGPINMHHTSWTAKDEAPSSIIGIAQTPDRWMWLASIHGMYRFDGVRFERFPLGQGVEQRSDIWGMRVMENGDLWIGHRYGGASVWQNGRLRRFGVAEGLNTASVLDFATDARGRVWASTSRGFFIFDGQRWFAADEVRSGRTGSCFLEKDGSGIIWGRCETGVYALEKGAGYFGPKVRDLGFGRLALARDGTLWATGGGANELVALSGPGKNKPVPDWPRPRGGSGPMLFERDGKHLWSSQSNGVIRYGPAEQGIVFGQANGLSGSVPNCFYQDVEGNIWVGTENGLDRFRSTALSGVAIPPTYWDAEAIAAGTNGALWVGATAVQAPGISSLGSLPAQNAETAVSVVYRDGADVWTGGRDGMWHYRDGRRERLVLPDYVTVKQFFALARDLEGGLWVSVRNVGVMRLKDGVWQLGGGHKELEATARWISRDHKGRMWFGRSNNSIVVLDAGAIRSYGPDNGLTVGETLQILDGGKDVWAGGSNGLYHFDGSRFQRLSGEGDEEFLGVSGLIEYGGALWLNSSSGITAVSQAELALAVATPGHRLKFRRLNHLDGLRGTATNSFPVPTAIIGSDGRLWFSTSAGIFWLDADQPSTNKIPPRMYIRAIDVDGTRINWSPNTVSFMPPNPGRVRIDYTAISLSMPERVRFQYRIDGLDRDWQEGGAVRSATYTGLAPGRYRFRVRASNNDGVWSESDGVAEFEVEAAYYETYWFRALCASLAVLLLWLAYRLRIKYVARRAVAAYAIRMGERERIARDLHDTLLQSVHGLSLHLGAALNRMPKESEVREDIECSLTLVEESLREGQAKVHGLRSRAVTDILTEVTNVVLKEYPGLPLKSSCNGMYRQLQPLAQEQLRAIAIEALRNAAQHAGASAVSFEVFYDSDKFRISIIDNGSGLPSHVAAAGYSDSSWGLVGMRERAQQIGAELTVKGAGDRGTAIHITLAAKRAYL